MTARAARVRGSVAMLAILAAVAAWSMGPQPAATMAGSSVIDDTLFDLQMVPLDGQIPPPFTLASLDGRAVTLAELRGRPVLLYFWASW